MTLTELGMFTLLSELQKLKTPSDRAVKELEIRRLLSELQPSNA